MIKRCFGLVCFCVALSMPALADTYDVHFGVQGGSVPADANSGPSNALLQYDSLTDSVLSFKALLSNNDVADLAPLFNYPLFGQFDTSRLLAAGCQTGLQTFLGGCTSGAGWSFLLQHSADGFTHLTFQFTNGTQTFLSLNNSYTSDLIGFDWTLFGVLQTTPDTGDDTGLSAIFASRAASVPETASLPLMISGLIAVVGISRRRSRWSH